MGNALADESKEIFSCCSSHRTLQRSAEGGHYSRPLFGEGRFLGPIRNLEAEDTWCPKQPTEHGVQPSGCNKGQEFPESPALRMRPSIPEPVLIETEESSDDSDGHSKSNTPIQSFFIKVSKARAFAAAYAARASKDLDPVLSDSDAASSYRTHSADESGAVQNFSPKKQVRVVEFADHVYEESADEVSASDPEDHVEEKPDGDREEQRSQRAEERHDFLLDSSQEECPVPRMGLSNMDPMPKLRSCDRLGTMALDDFIGSNVSDADTPVRAHANKIEHLAEQLGGVFLKYPRGGKSFFSGMHERFFSLLPGPSGWVQGVLGYWETEAAYRNDTDKKNAKGMVKLIKISQVRRRPDLEGGKAVKLKYKEGNEFMELIVIHKTAEDAELWEEGLKKFIAMVRKEMNKTKASTH